MFGRRRHFPGIVSIPFIRAQAERMAINAPIQGSQSDIIWIAMVKKYITILKKLEMQSDVRILVSGSSMNLSLKSKR